ncbi:54S ribosomal protein L23, mitochondrial [Erysiphe neolycopersici]|uniref:54S ribosomal protein L23, mitochondrial n=1 Tax=Erysiphe neolycopersici TaxID=212602 RepID=A0A420I256_9PEZI|nr:54S ribosomal protein L23, mitochondrial [Erysiphe neolycopersici]
MSQTNGLTKMAYSRTWHHISASSPHYRLSTTRPPPSSTSSSSDPTTSASTTTGTSVTPPSLGRLASRIAELLMGKHKPIWDPATDCGDYVIVTNCAQLYTTGKKRWQKKYYRHNTRPGSLQTLTMDDLMAKQGGAEVLRRAVNGMLPKNRLRDDRLARLKAFEGEKHPYNANIVRFWGIKSAA